MSKLTSKNMEIYNFIVEYVKEHLYAPSIREIGDGCGLKSTSTVAHHLDKLKDHGLIENDGDWHPRTIKIVGYKVVKDD